MTTKEILQMALERVKRGWCQGFFAETEDGRRVFGNDPDARKFCIIGACGIMDASVEERAGSIKMLTASIPCERLSDWNDAPGRTQAEVIAAFEKAIELEGKK